MTTTTENLTTDQEPTVDASAAEEFAERMFGVFNDSALCLLLSVGHQVGLFDTMSTLPPSTSAEIAAAAGLDERYVREWLAGVTDGSGGRARPRERRPTGCRPSTPPA